MTTGILHRWRARRKMRWAVRRYNSHRRTWQLWRLQQRLTGIKLRADRQLEEVLGADPFRSATLTTHPE